MRPFIIGVGRAGCRIANLFFTKGYTGILADTERSDLLYFPYRYKVLLGEKFLDGNGTGKDVEVGREVMEAEKYTIVDRIDSVKEAMDCIFVISAMGGGTGGAVDILMEELRRSYVEPVYYAGILPSEEDLGEVVVNFSETFKRLASSCNGIFPVDNDHLRERGRLRGWYNTINSKIFKYFSNLFEVGEYRSREELGENVLGATDVINTVKGISSIGLGTYELKEERFGFFGRQEKKEDKPELVVSLTEKAVGNTLLPLNVKESRSALTVVYGPRRYLDFLGSIPARLWVEKNIGGVEVRGGDIPSLDRKDLEVMVVLSGIRRSDRLRYLYQLAKMRKNRDIYIERIGNLFDKLKLLDSKFGDLEEEFRSIYEDLKDMVEEPINESP